jgi:(R,R)-butanediol dehydrogenase / meso-butanediol dehydrogenase / diacetyl reductase
VTKEADPVKAAMHTAPGVLELQEVPEPVPGPGEVKIRVEYAGICGSDVKIVFNQLGLQKMDWWPKGPRIEGHEASGVIAEIGPGVQQDLAVGQRVALGFRSACGVCYECRNGLEHMCQFERNTSGTWAEYALFPEGAVFPLAHDVAFELAALVEPLSVAVHLIDVAGIQTGQSLLIAGAGTLGLLSLAVALSAGASAVLVSEPKAAKRQTALRMGATAAVNPFANEGADLAEAIVQITDGRGFHAALEASGSLDAAATIVEATTRGGTVVWAGVYDDEAKVGVSPYLLWSKELSVRGGFLAPYAFYRAINLLKRLDLSEIVTDIYPLEDAQLAFDNHVKGEGIKTLLKCR